MWLVAFQCIAVQINHLKIKEYVQANILFQTTKENKAEWFFLMAQI